MVAAARPGASPPQGKYMAGPLAVAYTAPIFNPGGIVRRIELPLPVLFAWMALTVVLMVQGTRMAATRQETVEPARIVELRAGGDLELPASTVHLLYFDPAPLAGRVALYQQLPERR
ncbi:hypothetical protein DRQ32_08915, partial [bacterium]